MITIKEKGEQHNMLAWIEELTASTKLFSTKKACGDDMVPLKAIKMTYRTVKCRSKEKESIRKAYTDSGVEIDQVLTDRCTCQPECPRKDNLRETSVVATMAVRMAAMTVLGIYPTYMMEARLICLSKTNSVRVTALNQVRPIGIIPVVRKIWERATKGMAEKVYPGIWERGQEQAGFQKGRSVLDN